MKKIIALTLALLMLAGCGATTVKTGLGAITTGSASDANDDADGKFQANVTICAATFDANGKILGVSFDAIQPAVTYDAEGKVVTVSEEQKTKKELGDEYGMRDYSDIGKEVGEQMVALEDYLKGKTADEAINTPTKQRDEEHTRVPDVADLESSCTIDIGSFLDCLKKAYDNAK